MTIDARALPCLCGRSGGRRRSLLGWRLAAALVAALWVSLACDDVVRSDRAVASDVTRGDPEPVSDLPGAGDIAWNAGPDTVSEPPYVVPEPPACRETTEVGATRFMVDGIAGHVAIDDAGRIYAPRIASDGARELAAFDACGELLWQVPGIPTQAGNPVLKPHARLSGERVWLTNSDGFGRAYGLWCYGLDGTPCADFAAGAQRLSVFVGIPDGLGPYVVVYDALTGKHTLGEYAAGGAWRVVRDDFLPSGTPCAIRGDLIACTDGVYALRDGTELWSVPVEILDGTARHALTPAVDGGRVVSLVYGISTYDVLARSLTTGETLYRAHLGPSDAGQTGLLAGQPVIGYDGEVFVYLNVERDGPDGLLVALDGEGQTLWTFGLDAGPRDFTAEATHVIGRDGVVYLAVNSVLAALGRDGTLLWEGFVVGTFSDSGPVLSLNGDLAVRTDEGFLYVFATTSAGPAVSPWPAPGGDSRNGNAR